MIGEFPSYETLPEPVPVLTEEQILECLEHGAKSARSLKKVLDECRPTAAEMGLVLR